MKQITKKLSTRTELGVEKNIFLQWLVWQFFEMPRNILKGWRNFLKFYLNYFSIPLLIKTLFSPWRQYRWSYGRGLDIGRYLGAFFSNLIFRTLGAIFRLFLILIGIFVESLIIIGGAIVFVGWFVLPVLILWGLLFGIQIVL